MSRRFVVVLATATAVWGLSASPAMADPPDNASCVGAGASTWATVPPAPFDNFGQFTS
jgi:hypothetical protein